MDETHSKLEKLNAAVRAMGSVAVAYSGGVDSTFLLKVCLDELGREKVLGVIASSATYPARELEAALQLANEMGARVQLIETDEMLNPNFVRNLPDRCFHCKSELLDLMIPVVKQAGIEQLVHGVNADDLGDYRPGIMAAEQRGVRAPLQEAGLTKQEIRQLSKEMGLRTWNKPAFACLASRIPYGQPIDRKALLQVDEAEVFIRGLGFSQVRVRHHGSIARIELPKEDIARFIDTKTADTVVGRLKELGFLYVTVDLQGYRTGSMNEALPRL